MASHNFWSLGYGRRAMSFTLEDRWLVLSKLRLTSAKVEIGYECRETIELEGRGEERMRLSTREGGDQKRGRESGKKMKMMMMAEDYHLLLELIRGFFFWPGQVVK